MTDDEPEDDTKQTITMDDGDLENNTVADNGVWRSMVVDDEGWLWMIDWLVVVGDW